MRKLFFITRFLLMTFFIIGCQADGLLEDLDNGPVDNNFCPLNRLPNGLCPSKQKAIVSDVSFTSSDGSFGLGSDIYLKVTFNEEVEVTGSPRIEVETGVTDRFAVYDSGSGSKNLIFKYTSQAGDINSDLDYKATSSLSLNGGEINNLYGNASILTLPAVGTLAANHAINVETSSAVVTGVSFSTSDNSYGVGSDIDITITFNKDVDVTGLPQIELETGDNDRYATYQSGTGSSSLVFRYQVKSGDTNNDLDYKTVNSLDLNGGSIKDAATNDAILTLPAVGTLASVHAVRIDTAEPIVSGVSYASSNASYGVGTTVDLTITFNEVVIVDTSGGTPQIELETGATDRFAIYQPAADSSSITFRYTVQASDVNSDLDYKATSSLDLNSGTIQDAAGNDANLTLPAVGTLASAHAIIVETTAPTIIGVSFSNSDANYAATSNIDMTVTFSEVVNVVTTGGTPRIELETGMTDRFANYLSGTGTSTLVFRYIVQSGDVNIDLDYKTTNSLTLDGGTIKDNASNDAILTLPAVGTLATAHDIGAGVTTWIWDFSSSGDYTYPSNYVEVTGGKASLKLVNTTFSESDFNSGTHVGTYLDESNNLSLRTRPSDDETHVNTIFPGKEENLIGYWRFENNWDDSSGNSYNGVQPSGSSFSNDSKVGDKSNNYDGTALSQTISTSEPTTNQERTISYWFKLNTFPASGKHYYPVVIGGGSIGRVWTIRVSDDGRLFSNTYWGSGCDFWRGTNTYISTGQWYQVTSVTNREGSFQTYLNGVLLDSVSISSCASGLPFSGSNIIFSFSPGDGDKFNGKIDDLAFWNSALSSSEVQKLYESQNGNYAELSSSWTPKWDSIVGYWKMDGNWQDSSGSEYHGAAVNDATFSSDSKVGVESGVFDGDGDYIETSSFNLGEISRLSYGGWIKVNQAIPLEHANLGYKKGPVFEFYINPSSGKIGLHTHNGVWGSNGNSTSFSDWDQWHHVLFTYDGTTTKYYRDGDEVFSSTSKTGSLISANAPLSLGQRACCGDTLDGKLDDVALWTDVLSAGEIHEIYNRQKQKYAGHYESPIINLGASKSWDNLKPKTTLPFYKEITTADENSSGDYSSLSGDFSNGLVGYWRLNEPSGTTGAGSVVDSSAGGNNGSPFNVKFGNRGVKNSSANFNGTDSYIDLGSSDSIIFGDSSFSFSLWFKTTKTYNNGSNYGARLLTLQRDSGSAKVALGISGTNTSNVMFCGTYCSTKIVNSSIIVDDGEWHHVVGTYNATTDIASLYFDGGNKKSKNLGLLSNSSNNFASIGSGPGASNYFDGEIDDVVIYNRIIADSEVQELYRRGANRIKYQVKSCVDPNCNCKSYSLSPTGSSTDCDGDGTLNSTDYDDIHKADWIGKNGAGDTFSELENCVTVDGDGNCGGDVNETSADFIFTDFPAAAQPTNNQYFQYRVLMEAEENTACPSGTNCMPELESVEVGPTGRYYGGSPEVTPVSSSVTYTNINKIVFSNTGSCTVKYQLSKDGSTYNYWNGSAWATASEVAHTNDSSTITSNIGTFTAEIGTGTLYWKAFLSSDTSQSCDLDSISVTVPD